MRKSRGIEKGLHRLHQLSSTRKADRAGLAGLSDRQIEQFCWRYVCQIGKPRERLASARDGRLRAADVMRQLALIPLPLSQNCLKVVQEHRVFHLARFHAGSHIAT
jgi:hypothetical protein